MLPLIPFEVLIPLTLGATSLCLGLILAIIGRRAMLKWWTRGGRRQAAEAELLIRQAMVAEDQQHTALARWLRRSAPGRIESLIVALERLEQTSDDAREWLVQTSGIPARLAAIVAGAGGPGRGLLPRRWTRVAAARALARLQLDSGIPALIDAMDDRDQDVAYAAADALARLNREDAAAAIMQRISAQPTLNNARMAALIERMQCDLTALFRQQLERSDNQALFWTATLIGQKHVFELVDHVRPLLEAGDANVRAASCECIGELRVPLTDRWLAPRLADEQWFVQSHAARALGDCNAQWAIEELVDLLGSPEWWVRQNAVEALIKLGPGAAGPVERMLWSDDRFARNCAVEILERVGWIDDTLRRAARRESIAAALLGQFGRNGGLGYLENALFTAPDEAVPTLLAILRELGDDATYGRLRAAAEQLPAALRPATYSVAAEVRGR